MARLIEILAAITFAVCLISLVGGFDYADALTSEAIEKEAKPARAVLDHPLQYRAVVCQYGAFENPRCLFYIAKDRD